jgi:beta-N-acetylhexosaminidase
MSVIDTALTRLADGILMPPFYGPAAPPWVLDALADGLAGVVLFGSNVADGPQPLRELTGSMLSAAPDALIAIDEEGGDVTRLWYASGSPYPGNAALGAADDTEMTREVYRSIGADLAGLSINLNLAPCLDVLAEPENPVIGTRAFGMTAELVARHGVAAVLGLQSAGVAACVKHFPGHGSTLADSHATLAVVTDGWAERDLPPFTAAIEAGTAAGVAGGDRADQVARLRRRGGLRRAGDAGGQRCLRRSGGRRTRGGRGHRPAVPRPGRIGRWLSRDAGGAGGGGP